MSKKTRVKSIPVSIARDHLSEVIAAAQSGANEFLVLRSGKPVAVVIAVGTYLKAVRPRMRFAREGDHVHVAGIGSA